MVDYPVIVQWKDALFHHAYDTRERKFAIGTYFSEKALKYGLTRLNRKYSSREFGLLGSTNDEYLPYLRIVPEHEVIRVKVIKTSYYMVKYIDHYFHVGFETNTGIGIWTSLMSIVNNPDYILLKVPQDPRDESIYYGWVSKVDITPITEILYEEGNPLCYYYGLICQIVNQENDKYLIRTKDIHAYNRPKFQKQSQRGFEKEEEYYYQWVDQSNVYVYKDHDEQFVY